MTNAKDKYTLFGRLTPANVPRKISTRPLAHAPTPPPPPPSPPTKYLAAAISVPVTVIIPPPPLPPPAPLPNFEHVEIHLPPVGTVTNKKHVVKPEFTVIAPTLKPTLKIPPKPKAVPRVPPEPAIPEDKRRARIRQFVKSFF